MSGDAECETAQPNGLLTPEQTVDDSIVEIVLNRLSTLEERPGWLAVEILNLDGNACQLRVVPHATVLQIKHAVARAEGTPAFQQSLWLEGSDEEMMNKCTAMEVGLKKDKNRVFLIKGDAASWQLAMLSDPEIFDSLGDFMALSVWREKGGYEQAGRTMEAKVAEWELPSSGLNRREVLRRKVSNMVWG
jgi:hypothetical protein